MTTNIGSSDSASTEGTEEISEGQDQENQTTEETSDQEGSQSQQDDQSSSPDESEGKPKDKPDPAKQALLADLSKERKDLKAARGRVTELEAQVAELTPKAETVDAIQARYDRLEAFAQGVGLGKALDSKSFTHELFETDKDINEIVKDWNKANPSATSTALGSAAAAPAPSKPNINDLLRAASK